MRFAEDFEALASMDSSEVQPDKERIARIGQAGNAMHVEVLGAMLLHITSNALSQHSQESQSQSRLEPEPSKAHGNGNDKS